MALQSTFSYRARDTAGQLIEGTMSAVTASEVGARLRSEGKWVIDVRQGGLTQQTAVDVAAITRSESAKRVRRDDVIAFAQQLGVMLETGVPLSEALHAFRLQQRSPDFERVLAVVSDDVQSGEPISGALARWPRVFPTSMISLMKASEVSGTMAAMLARVGEYLAKERKTARQIKGALSYPMFMLTLGLGITVFLVTFVLPKFAKIYEQRAAALPLPTKVLLSMSDFLVGSFLYYAPIVAVLTTTFLIWRRTASGRRVLDWLRLQTPVIRTLFRQLYLTRAARTMATLMDAGVNLLDIIEICRGVTRNVYWDQVWSQTDQLVRNGQQISDAFAASKVIPPNVVSMIAAGERAGRLSDVMHRVAAFTDEELEAAVKQVTGYIEPIMICTMGVVIGGIALALLLPIFTLGNVMSGA